jgi:cellobiose-specific phosphotransferase system component IIA
MAVTITQQRVEEVKQVAITKHLNSSDQTLLELVIAAKATTKLVEAMKPALESKDYDNKLAESNEHLRAAHRYDTCLDVLRELKTQKEPFTLAKLT